MIRKPKSVTREDGLMLMRGSLARVMDVLVKIDAPETEIEGELLAGLMPVFNRFDTRLKSMFSIPQEHEVVGVALKVWCEKHEQPYKDANANMVLAGGYLLQAFMTTLKLPKDEKEGKIALGRRLREVEGDTPICCHISEEQHLELLTHIRPSTGDAREDEDEAATAAPDVMGRHEPEPLQ